MGFFHLFPLKSGGNHVFVKIVYIHINRLKDDGGDLYVNLTSNKTSFTDELLSLILRVVLHIINNKINWFLK